MNISINVSVLAIKLVFNHSPLAECNMPASFDNRMYFQ